jgi:hypothetical protein
MNKEQKASFEKSTSRIYMLVIGHESSTVGGETFFYEPSEIYDSRFFPSEMAFWLSDGGILKDIEIFVQGDFILQDNTRGKVVMNEKSSLDVTFFTENQIKSESVIYKCDEVGSPYKRIEVIVDVLSREILQIRSRENV